MENVTTTLENIDVLLDTDEYSPPMWAVECGNLAPFATIFIRLAPIPTVYRFIKNKNVGTLPLLPYTALISDSSLWLCFGKNNVFLSFVQHVYYRVLQKVEFY